MAEPRTDRDYPAEFEAWWATYRHRNREAAPYPVKKQIAFDAFYFAARSQAPLIDDTQPGTQPRSGEVRPNQTGDDQ